MLSDEDIIRQLQALGKNDVITEFNKLANTGNKKRNVMKNKNTDDFNEFAELLYQEAYEFMKISNGDLEKLKALLFKSKAQNNKNLKTQIYDITQQEKTPLLGKDILQIFTDSSGMIKPKQLVSFVESQNLLIDALIDINKIQPIRETKTINIDTLRSFVVFKILENSESFPDDLKDGWYESYYLDFVIKRLLFDMLTMENDPIPLHNLLNSKVFLELLTIGQTGTENSLSYDNVTTTRIQYEEISNAQKGMHIEKKDMKNIYGFNFTDAFLNVLYQNIETIDELATFNGFTSFYLAVRYVKHPMAAKFFFNIFDVNENGKIDQEDMNYFFKGHINETSADLSFDMFINQLNKLAHKNLPFTEQEMAAFDDLDEVIYFIIDSVTFCEKMNIGNEYDQDED